MTKKSFKYLSCFIALSVVFCVVSNSDAQPQGSCLAQTLDSAGYVLLHPYFEGKNWKKSIDDNVDVYLPETLCTQNLVPVRFDIGKIIDSTLAAFSTADGGLFIMGSHYFHYAGACRDEIDFLTPQKVPLTGIAFTGTTPWYLVKDTAFNLDTVKIVLGVSGQYCLVATIKTSADAIVKIDTLHMQNTNTIFAIQGGYDNVLMRDTCIWVTGNNGMLRRFSYKRTSWGTEVRNDMTATETVRCANSAYAGTSSGKIYTKNSAQAYVLDYSSSANPVNALYPQGAICNNGSFIENVSGSWGSGYTLGNGNYQYANFIKTPGGFGIELLDNQWKYSTFTYRNNVSRILLTNPVDIMVNNVNKAQSPYIYNPTKIASPKDTTISIYISDPDSNYSDVTVTLNLASLENDGTDSVRAIPDTEYCQPGALRLTDGILKITLKKDSVVLKTQTMLGVENVGCLVCNWKSYSLSVSRHWSVQNQVIISAGNDHLTINNQPPQAVTIVNSYMDNFKNSRFKVIGNKMIFNPSGLNLNKIESMALYDFSGRKLVSFQNMHQTTFEIPHSLTSGLACLTIKYTDGSVERQILPLVR
jgi:hypothetical protein